MISHCDLTMAWPGDAISLVTDTWTLDLIAKRKVGQTWHAALEARGAPSGQAAALLAHFGALTNDGMPEAEAAYRALSEFALLWPMTEPTEASPDATDDQAATDGAIGDATGASDSPTAAAARID